MIILSLVQPVFFQMSFLRIASWIMVNFGQPPRKRQNFATIFRVQTF
jgi:hypothetical protein